MQGDAVGEMRTRESMITVIQVHTVIVWSVFNDFKGEADALGLSRDHVVRALKVFEELLLAIVDLELVDGRERDRHYL